MIEKTLKTTQGSLRVTIPTQLNEVTLGQLMTMQQKEHLSDLDAISILSGIALAELQNVRSVDDLDVFAETVLSLSNQIKYLYNSDAIPDKVNFVIDGEKTQVKVIRNLSVEPAGAFMAARDIIAEEISEHITKHGEQDWQQSFNPSLKACAQILAHYFYCRATGKPYNEYEVEQFADTIKTMRVTEALPIAHANEIEKFLWDHRAEFPLWEYSAKGKSARQAGPRIRGVDKNNFNYPGGYDQTNYSPLNEMINV